MISEPIVQPLINGYRFLWSHGNEWVLAAKITKIVDHPRSGLFGELTIEHEFKDKPTISGVRINLTSQQARNTIAKRLNDAKIINLDWATFIDQICAETITLTREGEPVKELWTSEEVPPPEYLLEPILIKGAPTVIFGEKGVAKSRLSILFAACLLLPWYDNPLELITPKQSVKALILDWETEWDIVHYEAKRLQQGMNLPAFPIYYRRCNLPLIEDIEQIQSHIEKVGAEVLIIDSLGAASGGELNKAEIALNFFSALRKLKKTSLIIAQTSKNDEGKKSIFGSAYFTYYSRSIFELCKGEDIEGDDMHIALFHRWCNVFKTHPPMGFNFHFNSDGVSIEREPVSSKEFLTKVSNQQKILEVLKSGAMTAKEIIDTLEIPRGSADMTLKRLRDRKKIIKVGDKWGLLSQELV